MNREELSMLGFEIVAYAGDARSSLMTLLKEVRSGNFDNVEKYLKEADENLNLAHNSQTKILAQEAGGEQLRYRIYIYTWTRSFDDNFIIKRS